MPRLRMVFSSLLIATSYVLLATPAAAQQEFDTSFNATYVINPVGQTTVTQDIRLTNRLANVYASQYSLTIGSTKVNQISAFTPQGPLPTTITTTDNSTSIHLEFPESQTVVGKDQTLSFTLSYQNEDIASKNGRVLEVNIPKLANLEDINTYTVTLLVPTTFDLPTLISPSPLDQQTTDKYQVLRFDKSQLINRGISVLFGTYQNFDFTLQYHLENSTLARGLAQIALPPDTAYQRLIYTSINPPPFAVIADADGNWLAQYQLQPREILNITAVGTALLYLEPTVPVPTSTPQQLQTYLQPQPFWPTQDPDIQKLALKLKTPENIYNFIVDNLTYNYSRIEAEIQRLGAKASLENPQNAICTEFSDLFVALARAANIPARDLNGFAYTTNSKLRPLSLRKDVLHAWPEYYDSTQKIWIPVDPTWGNTTQGIDYFSHLDLNHFTFVIHGQDSSEPYPAGSYKLDATDAKDVNVAFGTQEPQALEQLELNLKFPFFPSPFASTLPGHLTVKNRGNVAIHQLNFSSTSEGLSFISPSTGKIDATIPPYGSLDIPLEIKIPTWWSNKPQVITATVNHATTQTSLNLNPFHQPFYLILPLAAGASLATVSFLTGRLLLQRWSRHRSLRRQSQKP